MKRLTLSLFLLLGVMLVFSSLIFANEEMAATEEQNKAQSICPKTLMEDSCMTCHTAPNFKLKEGDLDEGRNYPIWNMKIREGTGYLFLTNINSEQVWKFFDYLKSHEIFRAVIEITSPGGSLFEGSKIVAYMNEFPGYVETRTPGFAISAGCLVFLAGDKRYVGPMGFLMWHELWTFKLFDVATPSDKEEESRILRYIQDTINTWFSKRTQIQKEEIDAKIHKKEFWCNADDAIRMGFADGYMAE